MAGAEDITSLARLCEYAARAMTCLVGPVQGLTWGLANIAKPGFTVRKMWAEDGDGAVETHIFTP